MATRGSLLVTPSGKAAPEAGSLLTIEEAAAMLNVSVRNVREQIYRRRLPIVKIGRLVRIEQKELEAFIDRGRVLSRSEHE
jgi:excisionase family DNA binding protein